MPKPKFKATSPGQEDIRSFFQSKSPPPSRTDSKSGLKHYGKGKRKLNDAEDDDDFASSGAGKAQHRNAKPAKIKKSNIIFDSDSEEEEPKPAKTKPKTNGTKPSKTQTKLPTPTPTKTKPTTVLDFFGASPVQRSSSSKKQEKRNQGSNESAGDRSKKPRLDLEEHEDEDFQATLQELDSKPAKVTGLASKLAAKVRAETRVPETPDRDTDKAAKQRSERVVEDTPIESRHQSRVTNNNNNKAKEATPKKDLRPSRPTPTKSSARLQAQRDSPAKTPTKEKAAASPAKPSPKATALPLAAQTEGQTVTSPAKGKTITTPFKGKTVTSPPKGQAAASSGKEKTLTSPDKGKTEVSPAQGDGEKKKGNAMYRSYLNREGPRALGTREEPEGADSCLEGMTFVITGVMECFDKDELKAMVEKYGGRVTGSVSKKTSYLVIGREPGESKVAKAQSFGVKQIQEEDLYELIETRPGKGKSKAKGQSSQKLEKKTVKEEPKQEELKSASDSQKTVTKTEPKIGTKPSTPSPAPSTSVSSKPPSSSSSQEVQGSKPPAVSDGSSYVATEMWVDKYKPGSTKQIIGQQGDKSNAKKLAKWLTTWHNNFYGKNKSRPKNKEDGSMFRAALLSGPPGVGKTTTATLVCRETGFSFKELNASDSRNKKKLQGGMMEYLDSQSISDMFSLKASGNKQDKQHMHCLIMDEVDGVAGNEDRGGIQEMIQMIKNTHVPIICICNDRSHPKIRSLVNYCFDLRFSRPRVPQIKAAMMSIAFKEKVSIPQASLDGMIMAANQDVRQVLHNLSMWTAGQKKLTADQMDQDAQNAKKDLKLGPWDVVRQVFSSKDLKTMSFNDKMDLFFHDYSISPLFVQENYLSVMPDEGRGDVKKHLDLISKAADSLCQSDLVEKTIRSRMAWRLLPTQAVFASVVPGCTLQGYMGHMIAFPSWLGKNSTRGKNFRLLQELQIHMRRRTSASLQDLNQHYLPRLRRLLTDPLIKRETEGVDEAVQLMCDYDLLREDLDSLLEVTQYPGFKPPMSKVSTKVKSAFTRKYNQSSHLNPYSVDKGIKKKGRGGGGAGLGEEGGLPGEEGEGESTQGTQEEEEGNDDDVSGFMVRKKGSSAAASKATGKGASKAAATKGKGPAKGKAPAKGKGKARSK